MSTNSIVNDLRSRITGDVTDDPATRDTYSRDTSIFEIQPSVVVFPKDVADVVAVVQYVREAKNRGEAISLTARSAGTDMSGGPLSSSIVMVFTKYMNHFLELGDEYAVTEPGVFYRDFEKETLKKGLIMPSYPASKSICAMGGIVNNNSGGELTLSYGKTERYVEEIEAVLSDGSTVLFKEITLAELSEKEKLPTLEGEVYRNIHALIEAHYDEIVSAKPHVTKNSAGYALWNVYDRERGVFNLAKLLVGAQGTLAIMTKAKLRLVHLKEHRSMLVMFLPDLAHLPEIIHRVLSFSPESFESYDDQTFRLAVRFLPGLLKSLGPVKLVSLGLSFLPELRMVLLGGVPKLVLMAEFAEHTAEEALAKAKSAQAALAGLPVRTEIAKNERAAEKYWIIRRESFALLRKNVHGLYACPFIDDMVVNPEYLPEFLPKLNELIHGYDLVYTIAGHAGDGNFHIIPLMDLGNPATIKVIEELAPKVYDLVLHYHGSITGEHNDGIIRTPYVEQMFGTNIHALFTETKRIFDPLNLFNPGKKVGGTFADIDRHIMRHSK